MKNFKYILAVMLLSVAAFAQQPTNNAQTAGTATATGNGTVGGGVQRVAIASDNTAFAVNATLTAETTKAIGVVRTSDGSGNLLTSNSTTYTAKFGLDMNLLGTLGTAFSSAGKVDIKGADGDTFVRSNAASTFPVNVGTWIGSTAPSVGSKTSANSVPVVIASDQGAVAVTVGSSALAVTASLNGETVYHHVAAATDNAANIKGSAGQVYTIDVYNNAGYPAYVKLYNASSSPTGCGASNLVKVVGVQAGTHHPLTIPAGVAFSTGIGVCAVKGITDADDTALVASDIVYDIGYK